ncbi:MAG: hypothetical protein KO464_08190 [Candidatus Methanofastidiosum sp.]|nr:hypothetical protein [Methanofastidiosum sp.]
MKKIFAILISLLFVASVFGIAQTMAVEPSQATPERVKVGQIITVTTYEGPEGYDPTVKIYDPSMPNLMDEEEFETYQDASRYVTKISGPIQISGDTTKWVWTYRANFSGTIVFGTPSEPGSPPEARILTNPVTITSNSLPMDKFMKFFGFGNKK